MNCQNHDSQDLRIHRIDNALQHELLTRRVIGCAMNVHYQKALEIEMQQENLNFAREMEMPIFYKNIQIGTRRVDFFVERLVMVELKALALLEKVHLAQAKNYLEAYGMQLGLLINFGSTSLEFKRIFNNKHHIKTKHGKS